MRSTSTTRSPHAVSLREISKTSQVQGKHINRYGALGLINPAQGGEGRELYFTADVPLISTLRLFELHGYPASELRHIAETLQHARSNGDQQLREAIGALLGAPLPPQEPSVDEADSRDRMSLRYALRRFAQGRPQETPHQNPEGGPR
ncbi:hypothetical protein ACX80D_12015 [Arthrobacter sp. Sr24]